MACWVLVSVRIDDLGFYNGWDWRMRRVRAAQLLAVLDVLFRRGTDDEIFNNLRPANTMGAVIHEADENCNRWHGPRTLCHYLLRLIMELMDDRPREYIEPKRPQ